MTKEGMIKLARCRAEQKSKNKHFSDSFIIRMNENHKKICEHYQKKVKELEEKNHLLEISKGEMYDEIMSLNQSMHSWKEWSEDTLNIIKELLNVNSYTEEKTKEIKERAKQFIKDVEESNKPLIEIKE